MKRFWILILCACLLLGGCADADESAVSLQATTEASLGILIDQLGMDEVSAIDLLAQLRRAGYTEHIRMAFVGEDENSFRLWLQSCALDVELGQDGLVAAIRDGERVYLPAENGGDSTQNNSETVENSVDNADNPVENPQGAVDNPAPTPENSVLCLISLTSPIQAGNKVTLVARGKPGVEYDISVRYASGESTAQGLEPQVAAQDGTLQWTFRVASRVAPGEYPVSVSGGGELLALTLRVE